MAKQLGYPCTDVIPLTQDASARKYFRLILKPSKKSLAEGFLESETAIFCYLNPNLGSHKNFIHVCNHIDIGPKILEYDLELGVTIQTDVGKYNYAQAHDAWMNRYYVLMRHRPKWFPFNILIHHILDNDHGIGLHNHPFPYITIILSGGYWETNIKEERKWRGKFYIGFRSADNLHRVDLEPGIKPITIYIAGPYGLRKKGRSEYGTLN